MDLALLKSTKAMKANKRWWEEPKEEGREGKEERIDKMGKWECGKKGIRRGWPC